MAGDDERICEERDAGEESGEGREERGERREVNLGVRTKQVGEPGA